MASRAISPVGEPLELAADKETAGWLLVGSLDLEIFLDVAVPDFQAGSITIHQAE